MQTLVEVRIGDKIYRCKEVIALEIIEIFQQKKEASTKEIFGAIFANFCDMPLGDFLKIYPSEQRKIIQGIKAANKDFFGIAVDLSVEDLVETMIKNVKQKLMDDFFALMKTKDKKSEEQVIIINAESSALSQAPQDVKQIG